MALCRPATLPLNRREPEVVAVPFKFAPRSFSRKGTPPSGPPGAPSFTTTRAASDRSSVTAFSRGLAAAIRSSAASSTSAALTWRVAISAARPMASCAR